MNARRTLFVALFALVAPLAAEAAKSPFSLRSLLPGRGAAHPSTAPTAPRVTPPPRVGPYSLRPDTVIVFGPNTYTRTSGGTWTVYTPSLSISSFDSTRRFIFRIRNGSGGSNRVSQVSIVLNGTEVMNASDITTSIDSAIKVVQPHASNTLQVSVAGSNGAYINLDMISTPDPSYVIAGPGEYEIPDPPDDVEPPYEPPQTTGGVSLPSGAAPPYTVSMWNPEPSNGLFINARLSLNGTTVIPWTNLTGTGAVLTRQVALSSSNSYIVKHSGDVGALVDWQFSATDTTPPVVTVTSPAESTVTLATKISVAGSVSDETQGTVQVNSLTSHSTPGSFADSLSLTSNQWMTITIHAQNSAGYGADIIRHALRDTLPPRLTDSTSTSATSDTTLRVFGSWADSSQTTVTVAGVTAGTGRYGAFSLTVPLDMGENVILIRAVDAVGNKTEIKHFVFRSAPSEPSAPDSNMYVVADSLSQTHLTRFYDTVKFLYTASSPLQTGVSGTPFVTDQVSVIHGRVRARDGGALGNVTVQILGHSEFGQTLTRKDGAFDLLVNGGGLLTVRFTKFGYLEAQRQVTPAWQDYAYLDDVALIGRTQVSTVVDSTSSLIAVSRFANDGNGDRDIRVVFPKGTIAKVYKANGDSVSLATMRVRATEFTIGKDGPMSMPAALPPGSAYTYCIDLRLDEADSLANISGTPNLQTRFTKPVTCYVKDFLGVPAGTYVPAGYYDPTVGMWKADSDGVVIKIVGTSANGDTARINSRGGNSPDPQSRLDSLGVTGEELVRLKSQYGVNDSLWRIRVSHFSLFDPNFNILAAIQAASAAAGRALKQLALIARTCLSPGSIIECENRVLGERFPVVGTAFTVNYRSFRALGDVAIRTVRLPIIGDNVPTGLKKIFVQVEVAGRRLPMHEFDAPISANTVESLVWDGLDVYGRRVQGSVNAKVSVGYQFDVSFAAGTGGQSLGSVDANGETPLGVTTNDRQIGRVTWLRQTISLGAPSTGSDGLGGWTISPHHFYDNTGDGAVYLGDGSVILGSELLPTIHLVTTGPCVTQKSTDLPGKAIFPTALALGPDGSLYVADDCRGAILKITRAGSVVQLAGKDQPGQYSPSATLATDTYLKNPSSLALAADGSIFFSTTGHGAPYDNNFVFKITPDGKILRIAGGYYDGTVAGDGGPASAAKIRDPRSIALGVDGSLFIGDDGGNDFRIRRVAPNGTIYTYAGCGGDGASDSTGPARNIRISNPYALVTDAGGNLYSCEATQSRVRRVTPDGLLTTFTSGGTDFVPTCMSFAQDGSAFITSVGEVGGFARPLIWRVDPDGSKGVVAGGGTSTSDAVPATAAQLNTPTSIAVAQDGSFYFGESVGDGAILRVARTLATQNVNEVAIPSPDGSEIYYFSSANDSLGLHLRTRDALTGAVRYRFGYDGIGRLTSITDVSGLTTTIQRNSNGNPIAIVGPFGHRTLTALSGKYLASLTDTLGHARSFTYGSDGLGLIATYSDPAGNQHSFSYGSDGRLAEDDEPSSVGGYQKLSASYSGVTRTAVRSTYEGRSAVYAVTDSADGTRQRRVTGEDLLRTASSDSTDSAIHTLFADGSSSIDSIGPDPRFGLAAPIPRRTRDLMHSGSQRSVETTRNVTSAFNPPFGTDKDWSEDVSTNRRTAFHTQFNVDSLILRTQSPLLRITATRVDSAGRPLAVFVPGFDSLQYVYDSSGRLHQAIQGTRLWQYHYDSQGRLDTLTDPISRVTTFGYDGDNRLTSQVLPDSQTVAFAYDTNGNLTSITPPGGSAHTFDFDAIDQAKHYVAPTVGGETDITTYTYNKDHQLSDLLRPDGHHVSLSYESSTDRVRAITLPGGLSTTYTYFPTGQVDSVTCHDGQKVIYSWDGPLPLSETWRGPVAGRVDVMYDDDFRPASEMVDSTSSVTFRYDLDGLLVGAGVDSLHRSATSGLVDSTYLYALTATSSQDYDNRGALQDLHYAWNGGSFIQSYVRDAMGRITSLSETLTGDTTRTVSFVYTTAGRLREVDRGGNVLARYDYDANGNRIAAAGPGGYADSVTGTYDEQDRMLRLGDTRYSYTRNGELSQKVSGSDTTNYAYDALGNLVTVTLPGGDRIDYVIDGQSRRVGRLVNGHQLIGWLYGNSLHPTAELDSLGNVTARYVFGRAANVPDYVIKGDTTYRIVSDHLGSIRLVVNASTGRIAEGIAYDGFGRILIDTNPGFISLGFVGGISDPRTGLVRFGLRDYDPSAGRWTAPDPLRYSGGSANLYAYALSDPENHLDPSGGELVLAAAGLLVGGALNAVNNYGAYSSGQLSGTEYAKSIVFGAGAGAASGLIPGLGGVLSGTVLAGLNEANNEASGSAATSINPIDVVVASAGALATGVLTVNTERIGDLVIYYGRDSLGKVTVRSLRDVGGLVGLALGTWAEEINRLLLRCVSR